MHALMVTYPGTCLPAVTANLVIRQFQVPSSAWRGRVERSVVVRSGATRRRDQRGRIPYLDDGHTFKSSEDARRVEM